MRTIPKEQKKNFRKVLLDVPLDIAIDVKAESVKRNIKYYAYLIQCITEGHKLLKSQRTQSKVKEAV